MRYAEGRWRLWYLSAVGEVGRGEQPDYELRYVESIDGLTGWTTPRTVFSPADGFFDNAVDQVDGQWEMVLARGPNLHGTTPFPAQGLWWARSATPSGERRAWSHELVRLLDTDIEPEPWFARGVCEPSFHCGRTDADRDTLYLFVTGTRAARPWWHIALGRLTHLRPPPFPAPYYLATGRITIPGARQLLGTSEAAPNPTDGSR